MEPFLGSEALAAGVVTRGSLRWNHIPLHPNVYLPKGAPTTTWIRTVAAWLWTGRSGIVAGKAAAAMHGVYRIADSDPIEMIAKHGRPQAGVVIHEERIQEDEVQQIGRLRVTTPARTALDIARRLPRNEALEHLDALARKTGITPKDALRLTNRYAAARGIRAARTALPLIDGGAASPHQTRLRLMVLDAGLPPPRTNIVLEDERWRTVLALGWDRFRVGLEHEADLSDMNAVQRSARDELFHRLGWFPIRVVRQHATASILHRIRGAMRQRRSTYSGSRAAGQDMQRGPPRPVPSSDAAIGSTSIPESARRLLVSTLRS